MGNRPVKGGIPWNSRGRSFQRVNMAYLMGGMDGFGTGEKREKLTLLISLTPPSRRKWI